MFILAALILTAISCVLDAMMTVNEADHKPVAAGSYAAGANVAGMAVTAIGADTLITHGAAQALLLGAALLVVNGVATGVTIWRSK